MTIPWHYVSILAVLIIVLVWQFYAEDGYLNGSMFGRSQMKVSELQLACVLTFPDA